MSELIKAITELQQKKILHVAKYRRNERTGLDIPVYSLTVPRRNRLDVHGLLAGVTSERLVEYDFVARNLMSPLQRARILDVGSAESALVQAIREYGRSWEVFGIDLEGSDAKMDARSTGFRDRVFHMVICISTLEHIGFACGIYDKNGDTKAMKEISRMLKKDGRAIITVPYGMEKKLEHRIYDKNSLAKLVNHFSVAKVEFYRFHAGKWIKCSQEDAGRPNSQIPLHLHGAACACLLLRKQ